DRPAVLLPADLAGREPVRLAEVRLALSGPARSDGLEVPHQLSPECDRLRGMTAPDIRLVVADLDGTLLDEHKQMPDGTLDLVRDLQAAGIAFAPASGRQWATLASMFEPVADGLVIIAEN